jgi:hypothetical protein
MKSYFSVHTSSILHESLVGAGAPLANLAWDYYHTCTRSVIYLECTVQETPVLRLSPNQIADSTSMEIRFLLCKKSWIFSKDWESLDFSTETRFLLYKKLWNFLWRMRKLWLQQGNKVSTVQEIVNFLWRMRELWFQQGNKVSTVQEKLWILSKEWESFFDFSNRRKPSTAFTTCTGLQVMRERES